jgi:hypothetical protein
VTVKYDNTNYTFKTSYMNEALSNGDFVMNTEGNAYVKLDNTPAGKYHTIGSTYDDATAFNKANNEFGLYTDEDGTISAANDSWVSGTKYYRRLSETPYDHNEEHHVTPSSTAFRPYFTASAAKSSSPKRVQSIIFSNEDNSMEDGSQISLDGSLDIYVKDHKIFTTSHLKEATTIRIINVAGITFANYVLKPGETVETPIVVDGVYIVNKKKLLVK